MKVLLPFWFGGDPIVVHQPLLHLGERPTGGVRGPHVIAHQMDVTLDGERLVVRQPVEVR